MSVDIRIMKSTPVPPKVVDPPKRYFRQQVACRRCGQSVSEAHWNYCPGCGQRIAHYSYAGTQGWTHRTSEQVYRAVVAGLGRPETEGADDNTGNALRDPRASG